MVDKWKTTGSCRHGSGEQYVRKHWFRVRAHRRNRDADLLRPAGAFASEDAEMVAGLHRGRGGLLAAPSGLSAAEVAERRARYGPNALPQTRYRLVRLILRQFRGIFNLLLLGAAGVTFALGEPIDGAFILFFVFLGTGLNVFQEYKSNAAADKLKTYLLNTVTVIRDGIDQEVVTEEFVPGDILKLQSGDIVPADAIIREARGFRSTRRPSPVRASPSPNRPSPSEGQEVGEEHRLLQGVVVVSGNALAEVTAIGVQTQLAAIAAKASSVEAESELVKGIDRISKFILWVTVITLVFVVVANILIDGGDTDITDLLIFAIALAVSAIPEALPLVLTFALTAARSASPNGRHSQAAFRGPGSGIRQSALHRQDRHNHRKSSCLQQRLSDRGSAFRPAGPRTLGRARSEERIPEPFDHASDEALTPKRCGPRLLLLSWSRKRPSTRRCAATAQSCSVATISDSTSVAVVRSTSSSRDWWRASRSQPGSPTRKGKVTGSWASATWRAASLAATPSITASQGMALSRWAAASSRPQFAGFVSFADKLKDTTCETVAEAKRLNVAITIITGDALMVAEAVGREAGLVTDSQEVIEASAFLAKPVQEQHQTVGTIRVFARTRPEQKLQLIELLKEQFTVGFLGEGINDAPALKAAHASMVVESAADVARETADIILLKNDLRVIIDGIRLGRETHANTLKYIRATLVSNFGNFYAVAVGSLLISFLPMLPKQLLLLNLVSDFPMMAIAFDNVTEREVASPQRYDFRALYIIFITLGLISTVFDFIYFGLFYRISPEVLQTNWFIASVLTELLLLFSLRSMLPIEKAGRPAPIVIGLSAGASRSRSHCLSSPGRRSSSVHHADRRRPRSHRGTGDPLSHRERDRQAPARPLPRSPVGCRPTSASPAVSVRHAPKRASRTACRR